MTAAWKSETEKVSGTQKLKEKLDQARSDVEIAQRRGDLAKASELLYGVIPDLQRQIEGSQADGKLVNEAVTAEQIAGRGQPLDRRADGTDAGRRTRELLRMEDALRARVVGQEDALKAVANAVRRARAGLGDPNRRSAVSCFSRPDRRGQNGIDQGAAAFLFDDERAMLRIDMSEFMEKARSRTADRRAPGLRGLRGRRRADRSRAAPSYQVILFDEVEKAHEDVFNVLLQVLDDGRLTDGQGRTADFRNTHHRAHLQSRQRRAGKPAGDEPMALVHAQVMRVVRDHFRPEFLNRLDEIVMFRRLARADMKVIVDIQLQRLRALLSDRKIGLDLDQSALDWLANEGYDPVYGARPLKRVIQRSLQNPLASLLLEGEVHEGDAVRVAAGMEGLVINGRVAEPV